jgi:hypothetical protein
MRTSRYHKPDSQIRSCLAIPARMPVLMWKLRRIRPRVLAIRYTGLLWWPWWGTRAPRGARRTRHGTRFRGLYPPHRRRRPGSPRYRRRPRRRPTAALAVARWPLRAWRRHPSTCGRDRARPKKSSPKITLNRRTLSRESQEIPISSPRLANPIKLGLALSGAPPFTHSGSQGSPE